MNFICEVENTGLSPVDRGWIAFPPQSKRTVLVPDYNMKALKSASALKIKILSIDQPPQAPVTPTPVVQKAVPIPERRPVFKPEPVVEAVVVTEPVEEIDTSSEPVEETSENRQVGGRKKSRR
jgi:hypothetical protein